MMIKRICFMALLMLTVIAVGGGWAAFCLEVLPHFNVGLQIMGIITMFFGWVALLTKGVDGLLLIGRKIGAL